jgi:small-conductance mechanosensitive channel
MSVAEASQDVCRDPEPRVRFRNFGPSSLDFELLCWVDDPELRGRILDALNSAVYKRFLAEGIEIPYAKQDVFIKEWPGEGIGK